MAIKYEINVTGNASEKIKKIADGLDPVAEGFKQAAKEAKELERSAKKTLDSIQTPQERYNKKVDELGKLYKAGKLDLEQYNRALQKQKDELHGVGRASESIGDIAKKWGTVTVALVAAREALQAYVNEQKRAAEKANESELPFAKLQSVAKSPEDYANLVAQAREFAKKGAVGRDLGSAAEIILEARNAGLTQSDLAMMKKGAETGVLGDIPQAIRDVVGFQMTLDTAKGMSGARIMNMAMGAQSVGKATSNQLLQQGMRATGPASTLGLSPQELMALEAVVISGSHTPEAGGERVAGLLKSLSLKPEFVGKPLAQSIRDIQAMGMSPVQLKSFLGEDTALAGYQAISKNLPMFEKSMAEGVAGAQRDLVSERGEFGARDPVLKASRERRAAEAAEALATLPFSQAENQRATVAARAVERAAERGAGIAGAQRWLQDLNSNWLGNTEFGSRLAADSWLGNGTGEPNQSPLVSEIRRQTRELTRRTAIAPAVPTNP